MRLLVEYGYSTNVILTGVAVFLDAARRGLKQSAGGIVTVEFTVPEFDVVLGATEVYLAGLSGPCDAPATPAPEGQPVLQLVSQAER